MTLSVKQDFGIPLNYTLSFKNVKKLENFKKV